MSWSQWQVTMLMIGFRFCGDDDGDDVDDDGGGDVDCYGLEGMPV